MEVTSDRGGWKSGAREEGPGYDSTGLSKGCGEEWGDSAVWEEKGVQRMNLWERRGAEEQETWWWETRKEQQETQGKPEWMYAEQFSESELSLALTSV